MLAIIIQLQRVVTLAIIAKRLKTVKTIKRILTFTIIKKDPYCKIEAVKNKVDQQSKKVASSQGFLLEFAQGSTTSVEKERENALC